jgi:hypothetical protein
VLPPGLLRCFPQDSCVASPRPLALLRPDLLRCFAQTSCVASPRPLALLPPEILRCVPHLRYRGQRRPTPQTGTRAIASLGGGVSCAAPEALKRSAPSHHGHLRGLFSPRRRASYGVAEGFTPSVRGVPGRCNCPQTGTGIPVPLRRFYAILTRVIFALPRKHDGFARRTANPP